MKKSSQILQLGEFESSGQFGDRDASADGGRTERKRCQLIGASEPLPEGSQVPVLAREADKTFELDARAEAEPLQSLAESERGQPVSADTV